MNITQHTEAITTLATVGVLTNMGVIIWRMARRGIRQFDLESLAALTSIQVLLCLVTGWALRDVTLAPPVSAACLAAATGGISVAQCAALKAATTSREMRPRSAMS